MFFRIQVGLIDGYPSCAVSKAFELRFRHKSKGPLVATQPKKQWPTWMIVVAIVILIPPIVWALSITVNIVTAMSVGGLLLFAGIIWLFIAIKGRVDAER